MIPVRPLVNNDQEAIHRLLARSTTLKQLEINTAMEVVDIALAQPEKEMYTVYCTHLPAGDLIGYICFGPIPMTDRCYDLYWIIVDRKFTRRGVGTELMLCMEEALTQKKGRRIYIDTSSAPQYDGARLFYENCGFVVDSVLDDFYRLGDDKVIYRKEI